MDEFAAPLSSEREDAGPPLVEDGIVGHEVCINAIKQWEICRGMECENML